jgi:signal transduction histidine kinase
MLISTASVASAIAAVIGLLLLWSNPARRINRMACTCSFHWAVWLACLHVAAHMHGNSLWVRITCAVGAFLPAHFWIIGEVISDNLNIANARWRWRAGGLFLASTALAAVCFTQFFIAPAPLGARHAYGWAYYGYIVAIYVIYSFVLFRTFANSKVLAGAKKLELQIWLFGGCSTAVTIIGAMALNALTGTHRFIQFQPLLVLAFYSGTAYAITTHRIFDARQIFRVCLNKFILMAVVAGAGYLTFVGLTLYFSDLVALLPTMAVALVCATYLKKWLDQRFEFYPEGTTARQAAYNVAHNETRIENMEVAFLDILRGWGRTDQAMIVTGTGGRNGGSDEDFSEDERVANAMRQLRWVTPERLNRERIGRHHELLGRFMTDRRLGAVVFSETPTLSVVVGVGVPASRRAFTYPQVTQLQELAAIIEGALERTLMVLKIQHSEQLATVGLLGASLAHEIRNPLVSVKAIVQLLPSRYQEAEFREKFFRLISDEVVRIDRLTEQLLDLASPHVYKARPIELHPLLKSSLELVGPRAADKRVQIISEFQATPDSVFTDPAAVTQALLNLCFNSIQALDARPSDRWVRVTTRNVPAGIELAVSDNGPGITPEMRIRLFKPFQTTKSSGFGLGLTVCRDILASLKAPISIDKPTPGQGATFRITFPCPP